MIGIILWSDAAAGKAVIWCEDQGDLAFYSHVGTFESYTICIGDWVLFDLKLENDLRLAFNIEVLAEPGCPSLAEGLSASQEEPQKTTSLRQVEQGGLLRTSAASAASTRLSPPVRKTSPADLMAERNAVSAKLHEVMPERERGQGLLSSAETQNVIVFPQKGGARVRRA